MNQNIVSKVAENIRKYRKGQSLATLAGKAQIPISTLETIYYKRRIKDIKVSTVLAIAKSLGISTDKLLGYKT